MQLLGHQSDGATHFAAASEQPEPGEPGIRTHHAEANRLYQRGVAAARGGQRRVAAGLLTRSLQLNPRNEGAWLWLSGVLDDPHQVAFCLQSVLKLNPTNTRAHKGLLWLEERQVLAQTPPKHAALLDVRVEESLDQRTAREHGESWWVNWRRSQRDMGRVRLLFWSLPLVLVVLALILYEAFALAVEQSHRTPPIPAVLSAAVINEADLDQSVQPILEEELDSVREMRVIRYISTIEPLRQQLRNAVDSYRNATNQPGGASIGHVAAAQRLRSQVEQSRTALTQLTPPSELETAHADYIQGLELEIEAIDAILSFYSSFEVEQANLAALRFQQASASFDRARVLFDTYAHQLGLISTVSVHTPR